MADENIHFKEWGVARNVLKEFDDRIHELRKLGFSLLTALIAAETFLTPMSPLSEVGEAGIPDSTKLGVLLITLLLIVTLRMIEKSYQLYQKCSAERAQILERSLNLELTEIISDRHRDNNISTLITITYSMFALGVLILGYFILSQNDLAKIVLYLGTLGTLGWLFFLQILPLGYKHGPLDWTIDPLECHPGDKVKLTVTKLKKGFWDKPIELTGDIWEIKLQGSEETTKSISVETEDDTDNSNPQEPKDGTDNPEPQETNKSILLKAGESFIRLWDTTDTDVGIYEVYPRHPRNREKLYRKIIITEEKKPIVPDIKPIIKEDTTKVVSHADKTGTNQDFKARAQDAAAKEEE